MTAPDQAAGTDRPRISLPGSVHLRSRFGGGHEAVADRVSSDAHHAQHQQRTTGEAEGEEAVEVGLEESHDENQLILMMYDCVPLTWSESP